MTKKVGVGLIGAWLAAKVGLFKVIGLVAVEDAFAMQLGMTNGFTLANLVLAVGFGLLIYYHTRRD